MTDPVNKVIDTIPMPGPANQLATIGSLLYVTSPLEDGAMKVKIVTKDVEPGLATAFGEVVVLDFHRTIPIADSIAEGSPDRRIYFVAYSAAESLLVEITPGRFDTVVKRGLGPVSIFDIAASPTKRVLYFADLGGRCVSVFDPDQGEIVATVSLDGGPEHLAVSIDGRLVYAATPGTDGVSVIDTTLDPPQVTRKLRLLGEVKDLAVTPDGRWLIVGTIFSNTVALYDIATQSVSSIRVGREPYHLAVNATGTRAYTSDYETSTVSVVDLTRNPPRTIETIFGFAKPRGMSFSEDGRRLYVANSGPDSSGKYNISVVAV